MRFGSDICYFTILLHRSRPGLPRAFFVRYTRQAAAVLARADICRVTDSERQCRELFAVSRRSDREGSCPVRSRYTRQVAAVLARADICRVTDSECSAGRAGQSTGLAGGLDYRTLFLSL